MLEELRPLNWDIVPVNEEYDTLEDGHCWFGSGGTPGKHGVGILLNQKWSMGVRGWRAFGTRIGVLDVDIAQRWHSWLRELQITLLTHGAADPQAQAARRRVAISSSRHGFFRRFDSRNKP